MITSVQNQHVKAAVRLHRSRNRRATGQMLIEGPKVLEAAIATGVRPEVVFRTDAEDAALYRDSAVPVYDVSDHVLKAIGDTSTPQSPIAVVDIPTTGAQPPDSDIVVLVGLADPGNVGTIIRSAAAMGWAVGTMGHCADVWSPKVLRAGAGAHFTTWVGPVDLDDLSETHHIIATTVTGGAPTVEREGPFALLIGNEAQGLPGEMVDKAHASLTIPMKDTTESLNAAVAAALGMWIVHGPT